MGFLERLAGWFCREPIGAPRSGRWPTVRDRFLEGRDCVACGKRSDLIAHHRLPVNAFPELELDPANLVALCEYCHLVFGHLGDWRSYNPEVLDDAARHRQRVEQYRRIRP